MVLPVADLLLSSANARSAEAKHLVNLTLSGRWLEVVQHRFHVLSQTVQTLFDNERKFFESLREKLDGEEVVVWCLGISCLQLFVQGYWTGPDFTLSELLPTQSSCLLKVDDEDIHAEVPYPLLLSIARGIFSEVTESAGSVWWLIRCLFVHQRLLDEVSPTLHSQLTHKICVLEKLIENLSEEVRAQFYVETSYIYLYYQHWGQAKQYLNSAFQGLGLEVSLGGALGKRTKYQQKHIPQLFLKTSRETTRAVETGADSTEFAKNLDLNDDVRLEKVEYEKDEDILELSSLEQAAILGKCFQQERFGPQDDLQDTELSTYLSRVLSEPRCWCVNTCALLARCRLESKHRRTIERAMSQTQEVLDSIARDKPDAKERLHLFYSTKMMSKREIETELGILLLALGINMDALEIFTRLKLWEHVINCHFRMERKDKAESVARKLVEEERSARNLCILGDTTDDPQWYEEAWEVSNHKNARSQRSLANLHFKNKRYAECIPYFERCLAVNSIQLGVWYHLGFAALETEDWELSAKAYHRCVNLDPECFVAWNNISKCYIKLGQKARAWKTLQEALKCNYEDWKVWENYLAVSADVAAFDQVLVAYHRLLDLKEKHTDPEVLKLLAKVIVEEKLDCDGKPVTNLRKNALKLLGRITASVPGCAEAWSAYADILWSENERTPESIFRTSQYLQKALRCVTQTSSWHKDIQSLKIVLEKASRLAEGTLKCCEVSQENQPILQMLSSAKLPLKSVITKVRQGRTDAVTGELQQDLKQPVESLEQQLHIICDKLDSYKS